MKPSSLNKKLKSYSALAGSIAALGTQANAQIVYTDINPDSTLNVAGSSYDLDLDNDGNFDFNISVNLGTGTYTFQQIGISPAGTNAVAGSVAGIYVYPFALNSGDTVKATLQFNAAPDQSMASYFGSGNFYGNWTGVNDKYVGLAFDISSQLHYGWARLDIDSVADQFTIKDYAYNATPNTPVVCGETGVGITEHFLVKNISIFSSGKDVTIEFRDELPVGSEIRIHNTLGQLLFSASVNDKRTMVNLDKEKTGIYLVTITGEKGAYTKKIHLK